jgi:hypothetical protein
VPIHSSGPTVFSLSHIEGITLCTGEEVDEVAGGARDMGVDRISEIGDMAGEGQAAGVYGAALQRALLQRKEPGMSCGRQGTRLVLIRS